jgi:glutaredoxin
MAAGLAFACAALAQTNVYRWTDKDGKVQFSDVPPEQAKDLTQKRMGDAAPDATLPYQTQVAMKRNPVVLYVGEKCKPCDQGRELLNRRGIPYTEHNAAGNRAETETVTKLAGGKPEVPLLLVGSTQLKGFVESDWSSTLDAAGYPRALPPGVTAPEPVRLGGPAKPAEGATPPQAR